MKPLLSLILILCYSFSILKSSPVDSSITKIVAANFYLEKNGIKRSLLDVRLVYVKKAKSNRKGSNALYYVYNIGNNEGFVMVSACDNLFPVLAYSLSGSFNENDQPENFKAWMKNYEGQIEYAVNNKLKSSDSITALWHKYKTGEISKKRGGGVGPLLTTKWGQGKYYNQACPADADGPDGHTYTGCVATAMAQLMKYYNYPNHGTGQVSYKLDKYGEIAVNFEKTNFNWANMPDKLTSYNPDLSKLMYSCGVSLYMNYGPKFSGASDPNKEFTRYFNYSPDKDNITKTKNESWQNWKNTLTYELDNKRPVYYSTLDSGKNAPHAFICDGYKDDFFHCNWGWDGQNDGFYIIDKLNPGIYNFSAYNYIIIGLHPKDYQEIEQLRLLHGITIDRDSIFFDNPFKIRYILKNNFDKDFIGYLKLKFYNLKDSTATVLSNEQYSLKAYGIDTINVFFNNLENYNEGNYKIDIYYSPFPDRSWQLVERISESSTFYCGPYINNIKLTHISSPDTVIQCQQFNIEFGIFNSSKYDIRNWKFDIYDKENMYVLHCNCFGSDTMLRSNSETILKCTSRANKKGTLDLDHILIGDNFNKVKLNSTLFPRQIESLHAKTLKIKSISPDTFAFYKPDTLFIEIENKMDSNFAGDILLKHENFESYSYDTIYKFLNVNIPQNQSVVLFFELKACDFLTFNANPLFFYEFFYLETIEKKQLNNLFCWEYVNFQLRFLPKTTKFKPDIYESADGYESYTFFNPTFKNNNANVLIDNVNLHDINDYDMYKLNLDSGFSYFVHAQLSDNTDTICGIVMKNSIIFSTHTEILEEVRFQEDSCSFFISKGFPIEFIVCNNEIYGKYNLNITLKRTPLATLVNTKTEDEIGEIQFLTNNRIQIKFSEFDRKISKILIYNTFGQIIKTIDKKSITTDLLQFDLGGNPPGMYFIKFQMINSQAIAKKIIITR